MAGIFLRVLAFASLVPALLVAAPDASAADFSKIHGFWGSTRQSCTDSNDSYLIDKSGASHYELSCQIISFTRKANKYLLKQSCSGEEQVSIGTTTITLISPNMISVLGQRYRRCPNQS